MERYFVIQENFARPWEKPQWRTKPKHYSTISEANTDMKKLPTLQRRDCRIAEAYTVTRYKAVKIVEP